MSGRHLAVAAGVLLAAAGVALIFLAFDEDSPPTKPAAADAKPATPPKKAAVTTAVPSGDGTTKVLMDSPEWTSNSSGPSVEAKRTFFVMPKGDDAAAGTKDAPWKNLQIALCRLEPGDHLIVMMGSYPSPLRIDSKCQNGTSELPIQVTAVKDAVIRGTKTDAPMLVIDRRHWRLNGFEFDLDWTSGFGVVVESAARAITLNRLHIRNGVGGGVEVRPGAEGVTLSQSHIHHMGIRKGGPNTRTTTQTAGIRVLPGASGVILVENNVHSVFGLSLEITGAEADVTMTGNRIQQNPPND